MMFMLQALGMYSSVRDEFGANLEDETVIEGMISHIEGSVLLRTKVREKFQEGFQPVWDLVQQRVTLIDQCVAE